MLVAGVDGTKGGWVAIVLDDGRFASDQLIGEIESDFAPLANVHVVGVDIPIGFGPDRAADREARVFLKGAASTVFSTPSREVLEKEFGPGLGISAQAHALGKRIIHVTDLAARDRRFHEVHPEVSFRSMNGSEPLRYRKKSAGGALERVALLTRHGIEIDCLTAAAAAPLDDVLDAAAAAWSAHRIASGAAQCLGGAIWY